MRYRTDLRFCIICDRASLLEKIPLSGYQPLHWLNNAFTHRVVLVDAIIASCYIIIYSLVLTFHNPTEHDVI